MSITNRICSMLVTIVAAIIVNSSAVAHHADHDVTADKPILWQGKVARVSWDGAHVMYRVEVANSSGTTETWQVLGGSPKRLAKRGILKTTVQAGESITVGGYLNVHNKIVSPVYFLLQDGRKLFVGYFHSDSNFNPSDAN